MASYNRVGLKVNYMYTYIYFYFIIKYIEHNEIVNLTYVRIVQLTSSKSIYKLWHLKKVCFCMNEAKRLSTKL